MCAQTLSKFPGKIMVIVLKSASLSIPVCNDHLFTNLLHFESIASNLPKHAPLHAYKID